MRSIAIIIATVTVAACSSGPGADTLRDSFAQQVAANRFIKDFQRDGDDLAFTGPGADGGIAAWRVHIDSAVIEPNEGADNSATHPYKGTVKSSWFSDGQIVQPSGGESNLPIELLSNGISQDCWAFFDQASGKWSWE
jgi:hypothetical protein